ncbi:hypothetical protein [Microbulbifer elongatus]|uniref:hypothetical protein n=1 Tax=Microbulbifer elongatus TaxID=86173 RepID=UPI001CFD650F|nr:hypothetical protein [Microbulbifer elongatus]
MDIVKQLGVAVAVLVSASVFAGEDNKKNYVSPYKGEEVFGEWMFDTNAEKSFVRKGELESDKSLTFLSDHNGSDVWAVARKNLDAKPYRNGRVQVQFKYRYKDVSKAVLLAFSAKDQREKQQKELAWDNTYVNPPVGSSDWTATAMVLDIPEEADILRIAMGLVGSGEVEISEVKLSQVDTSVASTDKGLIDRLWEKEDYAGYLEEIKKWPLGDQMSTRYVSLKFHWYIALHETGQSREAEEIINELLNLVSKPEWLAANTSDWGQSTLARIKYFSGELTDQEYLDASQRIDAITEKRKLRLMHWVYEDVGVKNRMDGNLLAAKAAFQKAASREWGETLSYDYVDSQLKKVESALVASK